MCSEDAAFYSPSGISPRRGAVCTARGHRSYTDRPADDRPQRTDHRDVRTYKRRRSGASVVVSPTPYTGDRRNDGVSYTVPHRSPSSPSGARGCHRHGPHSRASGTKRGMSYTDQCPPLLTPEGTPSAPWGGTVGQARGSHTEPHRLPSSLHRRGATVPLKAQCGQAIGWFTLTPTVAPSSH